MSCLRRRPPDFAKCCERVSSEIPSREFHDVADVRLAMEGAFETSVSAPSDPMGVPALRLWQQPVGIAAIALVAVALGGLGVWSLVRPGPQPVARFEIPLRGFGASVARSSEPGGTDGSARAPFFSPDGEWLGFWSGGQLRKVAISGGAPKPSNARFQPSTNPVGDAYRAPDFFGQRFGIWRR